ncbi:malic enzyme [Rhizobium altiplani]|uniref:Malic enzyme n=1 Tax=Rhizobium altiplani TaxID=1864509 RepID=A0A109K0C8_9HYPH|nr:NADP-dependent malic enzyme [Rhizobium altiplani]KWV58481.1 malic enzyme [Rhizobium altiplani]
MTENQRATSAFEEAALFFHRYPRPGKLEIQPTKTLGNQRDLALAYSPGVAVPCLAIRDNPTTAADYTARGNLVAVISNGSAVLGLGNIGALAAKPVMEGKAVLFKKFADIDVFDIEVDASDPRRMIEVVTALEPTFGGINLEDIKAPECFEIEEELRRRMSVPVFHDDQHGTAIIVAAAVLNGLELARKTIGQAKIVTSGAGAAAIACLNLLVTLGARRENIWVCDIDGVVYQGRSTLMDRWKEAYAQKTEARALADVIGGADIFLGVSAGGALKPELVKEMAASPLILALANPTPEIMPEEVRAARADAMVCTGRSDQPNQVNNVLCFPYIFRGALDVGATAINEEMKLAAVKAIAALAREEPSEDAARSCETGTVTFGRDYIIPSPFDPRLILRIAPAVAEAAMETGVATRPIEDMRAYIDRLHRLVFRSGVVMQSVFATARAQKKPKRVIYAEGEDERVLRAAQVVIEEGIAEPVLVGRPQVVESRLQRYGLRIRPGRDFDVINPEDDPRYREYVDLYLATTCRQGVTPDAARTVVRTNPTVIAALAVVRDEADAMISGLEGRYESHLKAVQQIIGKANGVRGYSALSLLLTLHRVLFFADTYVNVDPGIEQITETVILAVKEISRFGIGPKVALVSHSNFGSRDSNSADKMREAAAALAARAPELELDGEMHGDAALSQILRDRVHPHSRLKDAANLLVFPNLDAANITLNVLKEVTNALHIGPILLGTARPAHILTPSVTSRGVVNMSAFAAVQAYQS